MAQNGKKYMNQIPDDKDKKNNMMSIFIIVIIQMGNISFILHWNGKSTNDGRKNASTLDGSCVRSTSTQHG